jgi:hypothetical protein
MPDFAVTALLAFAFAMIPDLRVADATTISTDLYLTQFCADCVLLIDDTIITNLNWSRSVETTIHDFTSCKYHEKLYCENFGGNLGAEAEAEIIKYINPQLGSETSDSQISAEYQDKYQENSGCTYFKSKLRDPTRVLDKCGNVESGSDYLEFFSTLTLTTVSVTAFGLLAGVWLLRRSFRNWQLRNMILRGKARQELGSSPES